MSLRHKPACPLMAQTGWARWPQGRPGQQPDQNQSPASAFPPGAHRGGALALTAHRAPPQLCPPRPGSQRAGAFLCERETLETHEVHLSPPWV